MAAKVDRVLWADDEIDLLKPHIFFLQDKGYEVVPVVSGQDAIDCCKEQSFDIIFLDPPYESGLLEQAMEKIAQFDILSPHGIMVAESPQNQTLPELPAPYGLYREYRYGKIKVSIYHRAVEEEA